MIPLYISSAIKWTTETHEWRSGKRPTCELTQQTVWIDLSAARVEAWDRADENVLGLSDDQPCHEIFENWAGQSPIVIDGGSLYDPGEQERRQFRLALVPLNLTAKEEFELRLRPPKKVHVLTTVRLVGGPHQEPKDGGRHDVAVRAFVDSSAAKAAARHAIIRRGGDREGAKAAVGNYRSVLREWRGWNENKKEEFAVYLRCASTDGAPQ